MTHAFRVYWTQSSAIFLPSPKENCEPDQQKQGRGTEDCDLGRIGYSGSVIRNVICDWSGTLVDDLPAVLAATNEVLKRAGQPALTEEEFREKFELPFLNFYRRLTPHLSLEQIETWFHAEFARMQHLIRPLPHAREFLQFAKENGMQTFVLSSVHPRYLERQAEALGLRPWLDHLEAGAIDKRKELPRLLQEQRLEPGETLFVGDMEHDIDAAHVAGVYACAVLTGYQSADKLRARRPHWMVENLAALKKRLQKIVKAHKFEKEDQRI